jgi:hypothetical protein
MNTDSLGSNRWRPVLSLITQDASDVLGAYSDSGVHLTICWWFVALVASH